LQQQMTSTTAPGPAAPIQPAASLLDRVDHVQIPVSNLRASLSWYASVLGLTQTEEPSGDQGFLKLPGGPLLVLWETRDAPRSHFDYRGAPKPSLFFGTSSMRAVHDALVAAGATITQRPDTLEPDGQMKFLFFFDPDGNHLGVIDLAGHPGGW
jgi:catechol 2,3-dioxygenase-like lactoylglutathione lyase family enzyme